MAKKKSLKVKHDYWLYLGIVLVVIVLAAVMLFTNSWNSASTTTVSDDVAGEAYIKQKQKIIPKIVPICQNNNYLFQGDTCQGSESASDCEGKNVIFASDDKKAQFTKLKLLDTNNNKVIFLLNNSFGIGLDYIDANIAAFSSNILYSYTPFKVTVDEPHKQIAFNYLGWGYDKSNLDPEDKIYFQCDVCQGTESVTDCKGARFLVYLGPYNTKLFRIVNMDVVDHKIVFDADGVDYDEFSYVPGVQKTYVLDGKSVIIKVDEAAKRVYFDYLNWK